MIACFSGRFDCVHPGHIATILRISALFDKVVIVVLDYKNRVFPAKYAVSILEEILSGCHGSFEILINSTHFGKITKKQLRKLPKFDVWCGGNFGVFRHMTKIGVPARWFDRAYHYSAGDYRNNLIS
jgi:cytidyltransferase-like protein